jgi:lysophospholipase L1-like esterase
LFDFAAFVAGHSEWSSDGLHLNAAGQHPYAAWLHAQLVEIYLEVPPQT